MRPSLVVLDEPTSQLDPEGASQLLAVVTRLADAGRSVVISEHRLEAVRRVAESVIVVEAGRAQSHAARDWREPRVDRRARRSTAVGAVAWSLAGVTLGHAGHTVLAGVDLAGSGGEVVALNGPNGGGKTTLLRGIAGTLKPVRGNVERWPGRIAYLPQNPTALLHQPTVRAEVMLTLAWAGQTQDPDEILGALGLTAVAGRYSRDLSSGEQQRAALAATLAGRPRLVLLDEPTRGMDEAARGALIDVITSLRDAGAAIVMATHDADLRSAIADRVVEVCGGRITESVPVKA